MSLATTLQFSKCSRILQEICSQEPLALPFDFYFLLSFSVKANNDIIPRDKKIIPRAHRFFLQWYCFPMSKRTRRKRGTSQSCSYWVQSLFKIVFEYLRVKDSILKQLRARIIPKMSKMCSAHECTLIQSAGKPAISTFYNYFNQSQNNRPAEITELVSR